MALDLAGINWIAVIAATVVYFALGAVMFAPFTPIGRAWVAASGYESPTSGMSASNVAYIVPAVTAFVSVLATALLVRATGTDTLSEAIVLGLVVGLGYAAAILLNTASFEFAKPNRSVWGAIDATYHAVGLLITAVILVLLP
jgi:hypothetical protein